MNGQSYYPSAAPTAPAGAEYSSPPRVYAPTTTTPLPYYNYYPNGELITSTITVPTMSGTFDGAIDKWSNGAVCTRTDQAAIISLGVICGLLAIGIAILLLLLCQRRRERSYKGSGFVISDSGRHKHRYDRNVYSRGTTDDITDYPYTSQKHKGHRRSQPVPNQEFAGVQRPALAAQWGNAGSPAAYAQFGNGGAPIYFQAGQGGGPAVPVIPMPAPAPQPQRGVDALSGSEQSELSSKSESQMPRHSSVRRNQSRTSSSQGTRSGRR